jgi:hypothetical protein
MEYWNDGGNKILKIKILFFSVRHHSITAFTLSFLKRGRSNSFLGISKLE